MKFFILALFTFLLMITQVHAKGFMECGKSTRPNTSWSDIRLQNTLVDLLPWHTQVCYSSGIGGAELEINAYESPAAAKILVDDQGEVSNTVILSTAEKATFCTYLYQNGTLENGYHNTSTACLSFLKSLKEKSGRRYQTMLSMSASLQSAYKIAESAFKPYKDVSEKSIAMQRDAISLAHSPALNADALNETSIQANLKSEILRLRELFYFN